jgi:sec-independent protein translocase protein TatA
MMTLLAKGAGVEGVSMFGLGGPELMWVLLIVLVLFGGAKIPQLMKGMGEGMREFRKASEEDNDPKTPGTTTAGSTPNNTSNNTPTHV